MPSAEEPDIVATSSAFSRHAAVWIDSFFEQADAALGPKVDLRYHGADDFPTPGPEGRTHRCLIGRRDKDRLILHVREDRLADMPLPVLQAALDMELALFTLDSVAGAFAFNFQREILSLISVSGSAVNLVRKMVWHLENALKLQAATRLILDLDRGLPQVFHYFHVLKRTNGDVKDYERMRRHDWVRGLFLCRKGESYLPVFLLQQAGLSPELVSFWEQFHPFLLPHDRRLLERLARQALDDAALTFSARLVRMFALVRKHLSI